MFQFLKKLSVKSKILLFLVPALFYMIGISGYQIYDFSQNLKITTELKENAIIISKISDLIHEMQKERALSVGLLNGKSARDTLLTQRGVVDEKFKQLFSIKDSAHETIQKSFQLNSKNYSEFRAYVDGQSPVVADAVKKITLCIESFINNQVYLAKEYTFEGIEHTLASLVLLEVAKENLGKVRAIVTNVLALDKPITSEMLGNIITFYSSMNVNINSPLIDITEESREKLNLIFSSNEWNEIKRIIKVVQEKNSLGQYGEDSQVFFKNISFLIDAIFKINKMETDYVVNLSEKANSSAKHALYFKFAITSFLLFFILFFSIKMTKDIISQLSLISSKLDNSVLTVSGSADKLSNNSGQLSSSVTEQASALQETVSSLEEVRATVARNTEHTKHAQTIASKSSSDAQKGKMAIEEMLNSVNQISKSNDAIEQQVEFNNNEFSNITKIISDISAKTKVINDIVFQTKLLSFNASVEAARAGEHGKGFSVVAEEVGNLATMSGNAAKEISSLLESSTSKVNDIVTKSKEKFSTLIMNSKTRIQEGIDTANECNTILDNVAKNSSELEKIVTDVTTASVEQSQGVNEIASAMNQMEQATQYTSTSANQCSDIANHLRSETHTISSFVGELNSMVYGNKGQKKDHSSKQEFKNNSINLLEDSKKVETKNDHSHVSNVSPFKKKHIDEKVEKPSRAKPEAKSTGTHDEVPAHDDPRFEEV